MPLAKVEFTVRGFLPFPIDMLRYDSCWPARTEDALAIVASMDPMSGPTEVTLYGVSPYGFTAGRWQSFGWIVEVR